MRSVVFVLLSMVITLASVAAQAEESSQTKWHTDLDSAYQLARENNQPMLLFISTDRCHFCEKMKADTFANAEVRQKTGDFVNVAVRASENPRLIQKLGVRSYPTTVIVTPQAKIRDVIGGYVKPAAFVARLDKSISR